MACAPNLGAENQCKEDDLSEVGANVHVAIVESQPCLPIQRLNSLVCRPSTDCRVEAEVTTAIQETVVSMNKLGGLELLMESPASLVLRIAARAQLSLSRCVGRWRRFKGPSLAYDAEVRVFSSQSH